MSQHKIGQAGILRRHAALQMFHILHHLVPAAFFGKQALPFGLLPAFAVTQMVVAHHHKAPFCQPVRKTVIALHIFTDAVDDLHHRPGRFLPLPDHGVNVGASIGGGIEKFFASDHKTASFLQICAIIYLYCKSDVIFCQINRRSRLCVIILSLSTRAPPAPAPSFSTSRAPSSARDNIPCPSTIPSPVGWSTTPWTFCALS